MKKSSLKELLYNTSFYIFLVFTIIYSNNIDRGIEILIRQISFLLFPIIIFYFLEPTKRQIQTCAKIFVLSNLVVAIYLIHYVFHYSNIESYSDLVALYNKFDFRTIIGTNQLKEWHPSYIGLFMLVSIMILIEGVFVYRNKIKISAFIILILFFISILLFLNSRTALYCFIIVVPLFLFFRVKRLWPRVFMVVLTILICYVLYHIVNNNYSLNYRLFLQIEKVVNWINTGEISEIGIDNRFYINRCNWLLFIEKPIWGYGVGDVQYYLNNCYLDYEYFEIYYKKFNTHSIYFNLLLSSGIISLILFFMLFINNLLISFRSNFHLYFFVLLLFIIYGISEDFLVRLKGVVFLSGINALMYHIYRLDKK